MKLKGSKASSRAPLHVADMMRMVDKPQNTDAAARALQEALDIQQAQWGTASDQRDALAMLTQTVEANSGSQWDCAGPGVASSVHTDVTVAPEVHPRSLNLLCSHARGIKQRDDDMPPEESGDEEFNLHPISNALLSEIDRDFVSSLSDAPSDRVEMLKLSKKERDKFLAAEEQELT